MKIAYIMRGLPGSGKSTMAAMLFKSRPHRDAAGIPSKGIIETGRIHSTDSFRTDPVTGEYKWDASMDARYHLLNQEEFRRSCERELPMVICDNTNITLGQMDPYITIAKKYGYHVQIVTVGDPTDVEHQELCFVRGTHSVPLDVIRNMGAKFELERNRKLKSDVISSPEAMHRLWYGENS